MMEQDNEEALQYGLGMQINDPQAVFEVVLESAIKAGQVSNLLAMLHHL
jgi:hypothetical protein